MVRFFGGFGRTAAACVTVTVCPATVNVAVLATVLEFF
jgi:hypothetical protein